jgi:hypothetical protein
MSADEHRIAQFERLNHSGRAPVDLVIVGGPNRRIRVDEDRGGGCVDARSHPGELLSLVARSLKDRSRRARVLTMRCIVLPQKQVGSAPFGAGPIIRKRICAPQDPFGHSHHSSRLFFTNATSARLNAPRRCTCSLRAPSPCRVILPTEGSASTEMIHCRLFGSLLTAFSRKDALRLRLRPALARLVSIPNSRFGAAAGYAQYRCVFEVHF